MSNFQWSTDDWAQANKYVTDEAKASRTFSSAAVNYSRARTGPVTAFAAIGLCWTCISIRALLLWVFSPDFRPVDVHARDNDNEANRMSILQSVGLILFQAWSLVIAWLMILLLVGTPLFASFLARQNNDTAFLQKENKNIWLNGRLMLGGVFCLFTDAYLNAYDHIFAWNSEAFNFGSWGKHMPFANTDISNQYHHAVGLLWVIPVYMYFCCLSSLIGATLTMYLRTNYRGLTETGLISAVWMFQFCLDFIMQMTTLRLTGAYAFAKTYGPLTLFAGDLYQYPIYNSVCVATLTTVFSVVRDDAAKDQKGGVSIVERGYQYWPANLQGCMRTFAVIGFCVTSTLICFTIPLTYLGLIGNSHANLPIYMSQGYDIAP